MDPPAEINALGFKQLLRRAPPNVSAAVYHPLPLMVDSNVNCSTRITTEWPAEIVVRWNFYDNPKKPDECTCNPAKKIPDKFQDSIPSKITLAEFLSAWNRDEHPNINGPPHWNIWEYKFSYDGKMWDEWNMSLLELMAARASHINWKGLSPQINMVAVKRSHCVREVSRHFHTYWDEKTPDKEPWQVIHVLREVMEIKNIEDRDEFLRVVLQWGYLNWHSWPKPCEPMFSIAQIIAYAPTIDFALKWMKSRLLPPVSSQWYELLLHRGLEHWMPSDWEFFVLCVDVPTLVTVFPSVYQFLPIRFRNDPKIIKELLTYNGCMLIHLPRHAMINPGYQVLSLQQRPSLFPYMSKYMKDAPLICNHPVVQAVEATTHSWYERQSPGSSSSSASAEPAAKRSKTETWPA